MNLSSKLTLGALAGGVLLVVAVLPAEYGVDPTGLGAKLGLTNMSEPPLIIAQFEGDLSFNIGEYDPTAELINESVQGLINLEDTPFHNEIIDIEIEDYGEVEYKFIMPADTTFVYSWEVLDAVDDGVYYDFHGHPSSDDAVNFPDGFEMAYAKGEGLTQSGSFTTPFAGYHGFYFMNIEEGPITVRLNIAGYWDVSKEMYRAINGEVVTNEEF
ncbi:hypothetical protein DS901_09160 [Loktanella sp. D2R18]|uniref:hypothetical protein n=1 Tax=Rhodobacterales TaxID=204455 RepID=UPI000DE96E92|nr:MULTISPECIES: hypothetical protein [Rhodobacterales]MDO6591474.1 hypothetical protein [Yoonia sp. 1_MG-2023]RBW43885.1 hypothetical protein DS901_09160 [Loktanella sp. D2R18]